MERGRAVRGDGIVRFLLPASVLHAILVLAAGLSSRGLSVSERATAPLGSTEAEEPLELTLVYDAEGAAPPLAGSGSAPVWPPPPGAEPQLASEAARARRGAVMPRPEPMWSAHASQTAASSLAVASAATPPSVEANEPAPEANEPAPEAARDAAPSQAGSTLSLEQLGIGANPFVGIAIQPLTREERANARLQAALQAPSPGRERQGGLGAHYRELGPVAAAARRFVLDDERLLESSAVLNVRVDAAGHVTEVAVMDASSQGATWHLIAARLARALASAKLPARSPPQGWGMQLRLASSVQLPSGATPGVRIGVLGQQIAGRGGPGSTSLELSPTSKIDLKEPIDSIGRHMDQPISFEVGLLKFRADPADLDAAARRVVEVALLSIDAPAPP